MIGKQSQTPSRPCARQLELKYCNTANVTPPQMRSSPGEYLLEGRHSLVYIYIV